MKKIKLIKWSVELSYKNTFVFTFLSDAASFIATAVQNAEDPEDVISFRLVPYVEYKEEAEPIFCDTDSITEADRMKFKQLLNEEYATTDNSDKEVIENEDVHQD